MAATPKKKEDIIIITDGKGNVINNERPTSNFRKFANNIEKTHVVAMSTNIDTTDAKVLDAVRETHKENDLKQIEVQTRMWLKRFLNRFKFPYIESVGYYEGVVNGESFLIFANPEAAASLVKKANYFFGQDEIMVFLPGNKYELTHNAVDYSTKIDSRRYVVFDIFEDPTKYYSNLHNTQMYETVNTDLYDDDSYMLEDDSVKYLELDKSITLGGYDMSIKGSGRRGPESEYTPSEGITEDNIAELVFEIAPKVYWHRAKYGAWEETNITEEDFTVEAASYIINLYRNNYFKTNYEGGLTNIIFRLLHSHFVRNVEKRERKKFLNKDISLNPAEGDDAQYQKVSTDNIVDKSRTPLQQAEHDELVATGKSIVDDMVNRRLSGEQYDVRIHQYSGFEEALGDLNLSDRSLAKLLLRGYDIKEVLKIYNEYTNNIGASSKATFINRKFANVIEKLSRMINAKDDEELTAIKAYFASLGLV